MYCKVPTIAISLFYKSGIMFFDSLLFKALLFVILFFLGFRGAAQNSVEDESLTRQILHMDSVLFNAFNAQDLERLKAVFSKDLEFYHDKGGLSDYEKNMESSRQLFRNVPDLRRQLMPGSTEVYPIKDFGAVQIGTHRFCHKEAGKDDCGTFKFVHLWKKTSEGWKLSRVISYDH